MASLVFLPTSPGPRCGCSCDCRPVTHGLGPLRPRYQYRHRWQPAAAFGRTPQRHFLSQLFEDDEPPFASLVLRLRESGREKAAEKQGASTSQNADSGNKRDDSQQAADEDKATPLGKREKAGDSDKFNISLKLGDLFVPEEISIKLVGRTVRVEAKHEEAGADGFFSGLRHLSRVFELPDDVDIEKLASSYTTEGGVLSIVAPRLPAKASIPAERAIPIEQATTGDGNTGKKDGSDATASQGAASKAMSSKEASEGTLSDTGASGESTPEAEEASSWGAATTAAEGTAAK